MTTPPDPVAAARNGIVTLAIAPSSADLRVALRAEPARPYMEFLTILARLGAGAVLAGLTAAALWLAGSTDDPILVLSTALAGGVVGISAFRFAVEHQWKNRLARDIVLRRDPHRVTCDGHLLSIEDASSCLRINLADGLRRIADTPHHLIVYPRQAPLIVLPKNAFAPLDTAPAFADFLHRAIERANRPTSETPHD